MHDFVQKTSLLCIIKYPGEECIDGKIDITKFRALKRLEIQKVNVKQICGIQPLRGQLEHLICTKSIKYVDDIITHCGGDNSNGFVWNRLIIADFSYNNLQTVDTSLEFAQYLQHLNLRHNQLQSIKAIKWLPHLKTLDLSFNRLQYIPQLHMDAYKRLLSLNMSNNLIEDLMGIVKLDALIDLNLSDNCLLDHNYLLPLSTISTLKCLNLYGNPLECHPRHRLASCQYLHKNCSTVQFILDFEPLTKAEKSVTGAHQLRLVGALNHYTTRSSSSSLSMAGRLTPSSNQTPASSVGSLASFKLADHSSEISDANNEEVIVKPIKKKSSKVRHVEIKDQEYNESIISNNTISNNTANNSNVVAPEDKEHLEIKGQIVNLRKKYGNEWLHTGNAEMRSSVLGLESSNTTTQDLDLEREKSRQMFNDYVKDITEVSRGDATNTTMHSSTPTEYMLNDNNVENFDLTPIQAESSDKNDSSFYQSMEQHQTLINGTEDTVYKSFETIKKSSKNPFEDEEDESVPLQQNVVATVARINEVEEEHDILKNIYSSTDNKNEYDDCK